MTELDARAETKGETPTDPTVCFAWQAATVPESLRHLIRPLPWWQRLVMSPILLNGFGMTIWAALTFGLSLPLVGWGLYGTLSALLILVVGVGFGVGTIAKGLRDVVRVKRTTGLTTITLQPEWVRLERRPLRARYAYQCFASAELSRNWIVLMVRGCRDHLLIPRSAFANEAAVQDFVEVASVRIAAAMPAEPSLATDEAHLAEAAWEPPWLVERPSEPPLATVTYRATGREIADDILRVPRPLASTEARQPHPAWITPARTIGVTLMTLAFVLVYGFGVYAAFVTMLADRLDVDPMRQQILVAVFGRMAVVSLLGFPAAILLWLYARAWRRTAYSHNFRNEMARLDVYPDRLHKIQSDREEEVVWNPGISQIRWTSAGTSLGNLHHGVWFFLPRWVFPNEPTMREFVRLCRRLRAAAPERDFSRGLVTESDVIVVGDPDNPYRSPRL